MGAVAALAAAATALGRAGGALASPGTALAGAVVALAASGTALSGAVTAPAGAIAALAIAPIALARAVNALAGAVDALAIALIALAGAATALRRAVTDFPDSASAPARAVAALAGAPAPFLRPGSEAAMVESPAMDAGKERDWENWDDSGVAQAIESYWAGSAHEKAHRETLADLCALYVQPDLEVVEVGCGTGLVYERLVPALLPNERYTGVDVSAQMLEIGRQKFPQARFLQGDGYGLQLPDRAFDLALSFEVLGHVPEIRTFISELIRVTRKTVIFTVWPAAQEVDEARHTINGSSFLYREYSHAYVYQQILEAAPGVQLEMEVGVITAGCWAYVLHRREGPGGLHFSRLFPVYGYQQRMVQALTAPAG